MLEIKIDTSGLQKMERALLALADEHVPTAIAKTLTRLATGARTDVMTRMETIFDRPIKFTTNSVRYAVATRDHLESTVYISDDAAKGISPRKYLKPEIEGGARGFKRSEKALIAAGLMHPDQHIMPAEGFELDANGNVPGPIMVRILSRLNAFGEMGYSANASERIKRKLRKSKLAAGRGADDAKGSRVYGGTDYFIARSKTDSAPLGIYHLISKGKVVPAFYFMRRNPNYKPIFPFPELVRNYAREHFPEEMMRAIHEEIEKGKR